MDLKITVEWLQSFDSDYEPSGLMTPRDRAELERRQAERSLVGEANSENAEKAHDVEKTLIAVK